MIFGVKLPSPGFSRVAISTAYLADEMISLRPLLREARLGQGAYERVQQQASQLVRLVRMKHHRHGGRLDDFLHEYDLSSQEGVVLMCLAESLLRIPDDENADRLIHDKLTKGEWDRHIGHSRSLFVNASTWGLMLTGRLVRLETQVVHGRSVFRRLLKRGGEPLVRLALRQAMRIIGGQFIMAPTIEEALGHRQKNELYSFDMLGEAALTEARVEQYYNAYRHAIAALAGAVRSKQDIEKVSISIKLSALHPRYIPSKRSRVQAELIPRVLALARKAHAAGIGLMLDAEESDRLELMLDVFGAVFQDSSLKGWQGFGLALQAYQKRAAPVLDYLLDLAHKEGRRIPVRLVKGAYWDMEIKRAQEQGLSGYPVFTRKASTDVSFLALARRLLNAREALYPQFATHNAHTVAWILEVAGEQRQGFEFQRLYGMGASLYNALQEQGVKIPCRVYTPVGGYRNLLPYLVRRLLENGANTSFVNRLGDPEIPVEQIIADPTERVRTLPTKLHPHIPLPPNLYGRSRRNSLGINLDDPLVLKRLMIKLDAAMEQQRQAFPFIRGEQREGTVRVIREPRDWRRVVGKVIEADQKAVAEAIAEAAAVAPGWGATPVLGRAECLEQAADLFENHQAELMALCIREAGKTIRDSLAEVREAVDACRYYAAEIRRCFALPKVLSGPTGEYNELSLHGRGVFVCISPWNSPLAIFTGQIAAALAAGNAVIAKPAKQTPLIAAFAIQLLHEAGIPPRVLHLLPGEGQRIGAGLVSNPRVNGVAFTGSTKTAREINRLLAEREGPIVPLIAETGGQSVMVVDSSALPEQVVTDIITSTLNSAGQRCSAPRVLFLQEEIAEPVLEMLIGAMKELQIGDPGRIDTDIGPLIDEKAKERLETHCQRMNQEAYLLCCLPLPEASNHGCYFAPRVYELDSLAQLTNEVFGPILHVIRYSSRHLNEVIDSINQTGYSLTLGIHSRVDETVRYIQNRARVGNLYVNRNMIGAVVGVHPAGGVGPQAGGSRYLLRFSTERSTSINTAAVGGDIDLASLRE